MLKQVNRPNAGLLPDFGNFCAQRSKPVTNDIKGIMDTKCVKEYDRYEGVKKMVPYAKGISAKTHKFDAKGNETETDFRRMFTIIKDAGFSGYVGIEYEGGLCRCTNPQVVTCRRTRAFAPPKPCLNASGPTSPDRKFCREWL